MNDFGTPTKKQRLDSSELAGYITNVTPEKLSQSNNTYFDVEVKTSPSLKSKIRVMVDNKHSSASFNTLKENHQPITMSNLSPVKSGGKKFFNPKLGAILKETESLDFNHNDQENLTVSEILEENPSCLFSVQGQVKWVEYARTVTSNGNERHLREGRFMDSTQDSVSITIWGNELYELVDENKTYTITDVATSTFNNILRIQTTGTTHISEATNVTNTYNWTNTPLSAYTRVCCPEIISAKKDIYINCRNNDCRKKIDVNNEERKTVVCSTCNRAMLLKKCTLTYNFEIVIMHHDKQVKLTAFPESVAEYFTEASVDIILETEHIDITYDKKRIVIKFEDHKEDLA